MKSLFYAFVGFALASMFAGCGEEKAQFVRVSSENPRYLCFEDGTPWIPNGYNICFPRPFFYDKTEDEAFELIERQFAELSKNGGDFTRVWVSADFYDVEKSAGVFDESKFARIDRMLALAKKYGIRVKFCMEHFRNIKKYDPAANEKGLSLIARMFLKPAFSGEFSSISEYLSSERGRKLYIKYLSEFSRRYGDNPQVFGIELWNEINAVSADKKIVADWTEFMLGEAKKLFPRHLVLQSVGSFDSDSGLKWNYPVFSTMKGNEIAQVHRYLDEGAPFEVCRGAVDILAADAVSTVRAMSKDRPVILAETGAVKPRHSGPSDLYEKDVDGIILHDAIFAPFYAGAAAGGQCWHWEVYILKNNLFWHFGRFAKVIAGVNPIAERFEPVRADSDGLRVYVLDGKKTVMGWVRDAKSDWKTELRMGEKPREISGAKIELAKILASRKIKSAEVYNPWTDKTELVKIENGAIVLPKFVRSTTFKINLE